MTFAASLFHNETIVLNLLAILAFGIYVTIWHPDIDL